MALVTMPLNATVNMAGREHSVTSPAVKTAPMVSASHPMNVSAQMGGTVKTVMSVNVVLDVSMVLAEITPSHVIVKLDGRDLSVINLHAVWIVTMEFVTLLVKLIQPISACANLDGKEQAAIFADLIGGVPTRMRVLVTIPMNASVSTRRLILKAFATTQC
jgi:hypothetical protein